MKHSLRRSTSGFTLVELLVVMAIIAILASVVLVSGTAAINAAKRAKANNTASQIQLAIMNYYTEYGVYPIPAGAGADVLYNNTDSVHQGPLMIALCGNINAYLGATAATVIPNTRQIAYLTPKKSEVDSKGILFNPFSTQAAPQYFNIAMDADYSGILTGAPDFSTAAAGSACPPAAKPITQGVAIWACCDPKNITTPTSSKSPQLWVHTY